MTETDNDDYEPWSKEDMEAMLAAGYTPEYISLTKWVVLHKHYVTVKCIDMSWLNGNTCALCNEHYSKNGNDDDTDCDGCTLYKQMGITCNHEDHPYCDARFGRTIDIIPGMEAMIVQLVKLAELHGVRKDGR